MKSQEEWEDELADWTAGMLADGFDVSAVISALEIRIEVLKEADDVVTEG